MGYQTMLERIGHRLRSAVDLELLKDVLDVVSGRRYRNGERLGHGSGIHAAGQEIQHLQLAMRQHYIVLAGSYNRRDRVSSHRQLEGLHCHQYLV